MENCTMKSSFLISILLVQIVVLCIALTFDNVQSTICNSDSYIFKLIVQVICITGIFSIILFAFYEISSPYRWKYFRTISVFKTANCTFTAVLLLYALHNILLYSEYLRGPFCDMTEKQFINGFATLLGLMLVSGVINLLSLLPIVTRYFKDKTLTAHRH